MESRIVVGNSSCAPRISFSSDLDVMPIGYNELSQRDTSILEYSSSDFEFSYCCSLEQEQSCSADELFSNGMILPVQVQERFLASKQVHKLELPPLVSVPRLHGPNSTENSRKESAKKEVIMVVNSELEEKPDQYNKSFWGFKRSNSLNCDIKKSLIFSLPLLSRSNSTGSVPNPKRAMLKDVHKQSSHKHLQPSNSMARKPSSGCKVNQLPQKPPLNKNNHGGSYGSNGTTRISPLLNVPPPYISRGTVNLFGLGSFLGNGKERRKKK